METGEIYPRLFCLMQHRRKENYIKLYQLIADKGWDFEIMKPGGKIYMDMEAANKCGCQECLNKPDVCVYYFHLCGITNKSSVDIGLRKLVFCSPSFTHHCRMINALATVPLKYVEKTFRSFSSTLKKYTLQLCPF